MVRVTGMPERVALAFAAYVQFGPKRSLERLAATCEAVGVKAASATLHHWSVKYQWQRRIKQHDRMRVAEIEADLAQHYGAAVEHDLSGLRAVQDRFIARLAIDPADPRLTRAQRRRAVTPSFRDFRKALEIERMLLGIEPRQTARGNGKSREPS